MKALRTLSAALLVLIAGCSAAPAQQVPLQAGPWTAGRAPMYSQSGGTQPIIQDSGPASGGQAGLGLAEGLYVARGTGAPPYAAQGTGPFGTNWCNYDGPTTSADGYHYLCLSPNAEGGGLIAYGAAGGAADLPLQFMVNDTLYEFPFVTSGVVGPPTTIVGDIATWNNTSGTLLADSGKTLPSGAVVGTTDVQTLSNKTLASPILTGTVSGANTIPLSVLAQSGANTMLGNWTGSSANVTANAMPSCADTGGNHLNYVSGTGITCGTSQGSLPAGVDQNILNLQSGSYAIQTSDCGKTVLLSGGGMDTVTLPAPGAFSSTCSVVVKNNDTRAKVLSGFPPDQPRLLWPHQSLSVKIENGAWLNFYKPGRYQIGANATLYVNPSLGNDSNDGLATGTGAFQTMQKAWDVLVSSIDMNEYDVTISLQAGTYTTGLKAGPQPPVGGGEVSVIGDVSTPGNVIIAPSAANSIGFQVAGPIYVTFGGFYCNSSNLLTCIYVDLGGVATLGGNSTFGTSSGSHMQVSHGMIFVNSSYSITGNAQYHLYSGYGSQIEYANITATLTGVPAFTFFAYAYVTGNITAIVPTFTGSATGTRYVSSQNSVIDASGNGANFFPGNVAGSTNNGGTYIP